MKKELYLSIRNIYFLFPLIIFVFVSIIHCYTTITEYNAFLSTLTVADKSLGNCCFPLWTSFNLWIGNSDSALSRILFYCAPFFSALPYSWSYCRDLKSHQILDKTRSKNQYTSKLLGVFISSGLLISIPLFINFIGISLFIPSVKPDSVYCIYYKIFSNNFIGDLFYNAPYVYILFYIILNFTIYGLLGCVGASFSTFFDSRYMAVFMPIMLIVIIEALKIVFSRFTNVEISLLSYMYPTNSIYDSGKVLFLEVFILFILILIFSKIGVKGNNEN